MPIPKTIPRGIRNCNPGNLRPDRDNPWRGEGVPDGDYCRFVHPRWGIRAMVRNLVAYRDKHKLDTVRGVISRWAPGEENDTEAYIASVSARLRVKPDDKLGLRAWSPMMDLVKAIIWHENGEYPYDDAMVEATVKGAMSE